jgi:hypothetical protein
MNANLIEAARLSPSCARRDGELLVGRSTTSMQIKGNCLREQVPFWNHSLVNFQFGI